MRHHFSQRGENVNQILKVTPNDIKHLNGINLTKTLKGLLSNELKDHSLSETAAFVPLNINAPDGGEDGFVKWRGLPEKTTYLPSNYCLFQCKATRMWPKSCYNEMFQNGQGKTLKRSIANALNKGATYILFTHQSLNSKQINARIKKIREALKDADKNYHAKVKIEIYDANRISMWANSFLSSIIEIKQFLGQTVLSGLQTWNHKISYKDFQNFSYISDDKNRSHIKNIKEQVKEKRSIIRIVGLSGLGKTRMVLEAFRPDEDSSCHSSTPNGVIYLDISQIDSNAVITNVRNWSTQGLRGILIVDNCNLVIHNLLKAEIIRDVSNLSLITIDSSTESKDHSQEKYLFINVERSPDETVRSIFNEYHSNQVNQDTLNKIVKFSNGFPQIAILLMNANIKLGEDICRLNDENLANELIWGQEPYDRDAYKTLKACSIFNHVGFKNDVRGQYEFISKTICKFDEPEDFYRYITQFKERGIIDSKGDFISVVPKPLAIRLAAKWWQEYPSNKAKEFLSKVPESLTESLCKQIRMLNFENPIKDLTSDLCGTEGLFGNAKALNSKWGSRLFCSLVELNPTSTSSALKRIFEFMSSDNVFKFKEGRRNLVLALEKLSFWKESFDDSVIVLFKMAISENEAWANNATGQLTALFKVYLPGTQADLNQRSKFLLRKISDLNEDNVELVLSLCSSAFEMHHFSRMAGPEDQGSRPVEQDHTPSRTEMREYWSSIIKQLILKNQQSERNISIKIKNFLGNELRKFVNGELFEEIDLIIAEFKNDGFWQLGYREICESLKYNKESASDEVRKKLINLQKQLSPVTLQEQIQNFVIKDSFYDIFDQNEINEKMDRFVSLMNNDQAIICNMAKALTTNRIHCGYYLGRKLAERITDINSIFNSLVSELQQGGIDPTVIGGIVSYWSEFDSDRYKKALDLFYEDEILRQYLFYLIENSKFALSDLDRIFVLIDDGVLNINIFIQSHAVWLKLLPSDDIKTFVQKVKSSSNEGPSVAFILLHSLFLNNNIPNEFQEEMSSVITETKFLDNISKKSGHELDYWTDIVTKFIKSGDLKIINFYSKKIINMLTNNGMSSEFIGHAHKLLKELIKMTPRKVLEYIIEIMNDCDKKKISWLSYNLRSHHYTGEPFYFDSIDIQVLKEYCIKNKALPKFLAGTTRVYKKNEHGLTILPITKMLLDEYSDSDDIITEISSNIRTYNHTGETLTLFNERLEFLALIDGHSKTSVKRWASAMVTYYEGEIQKRTRARDEENAGIYRHQ